MVDTVNPVNLGQKNNAGDTRALFVKHFLTEALRTFHTECVTYGRHWVKTIQNGDTAHFPVVGIASGGYHTKGTRLEGRNTEFGRRTLVVDDTLISDAFVANIDKLMSNRDETAEIAQEQGKFLAEQMDRTILQLKALAARVDVPTIAQRGDKGAGKVFTDANYKTDGGALVQGLFDAGVELSRKGVRKQETCAFLSPLQISRIVLNKDAINRDYNGAIAGFNGSIAEGSVGKVNGIEIIETNHMPEFDLSTDLAIQAAAASGSDARFYEPSLIRAKYRGDFSGTAAIITHKQAVGSVVLKDMTMKYAEIPDRDGWLIFSKYIMGHGILRPECAVELNTATPLLASQGSVNTGSGVAYPNPTNGHFGAV